MKQLCLYLFFSLIISTLCFSQNSVNILNLSDTESSNIIEFPKTVTELPADYPTITVKNVKNPAPGYFFIANPAKIANYGNFCIIADNEGKTINYKRTVVRGYDFQMQPNGLFTYADAVLPKGWFWANCEMYVLDQNMNVVDTFTCKNGYQADMHECRWLPNGHVILLAQNPQNVDMSEYFKGGDPNAIVAGTIIQELDNNKNVVFQWRSWDYLKFDETYEDTLAYQVNPFHFNAMDITQDGNIIVSVRHNCQILKINRKTGEIMWRLGGKKNDFQFIGEYEPVDRTYFSHQHNIKQLPNGNISLFDNGWIRNPQFSRGVEYKLDEVNMTATKVWDFRHTPDIYTDLMGSVQRLSNGNTVICWGGPNPEGREMITEVNSENEIQLEVDLPPLYTAYRVYKHTFPYCQSTAKLRTNEVLKGNTYKFNKDTNVTGISIFFKELSTFIYNGVNVEKFPCAALYPKFEGKAPMIYNGRVEITDYEIDSSETEIYFDLEQYPEVLYPEKTIVFKRDTIGKGIFKPLETSYNSANNVLTAKSKNFGEYILGWIDISSDNISAPILINPKKNQKLNNNKPVEFFWTGRGYFELFQLQASNDINFSNLLIDTVLNPTQLSTIDLPKNSVIYWRVRTKVEDNLSPWSLDSFNITDPLIKLITPNGGEVADVNVSNYYKIKWETNIQDTVKIELYKNDLLQTVIVEKFQTNTGAYSWTIDASTVEDTNYKIKVGSIVDSKIFSMSENNFTIKNKSIGVFDFNYSKNNSYLEPNYPNPTNDNTKFRFTNIEAGNVTLTIYDIFGNKVTTLVDAYYDAGTYTIDWNVKNIEAGTYFCQLRSGTEQEMVKVIIIK